MAKWVLLAGLVGCAPREGGVTLHATCGLDPENTLRIVCEVLRTPAGPVEITVDDPLLGRTRRFTSSADRAHHTVRIWGLHEETEIAWTVRAEEATAAGTTTTGAVPVELGEPPVVEVSGDHRTEAVMLQRGCFEEPNLAIVDDQGRFLWYDWLTDANALSSVLGYSLTADSVVVLLSRDTVLEIGFDGVVRQVLRFGEELERSVHHDAIVTADRFTYVLTADQGTDANGNPYVHDGIDVFDPSGARVTQWQLGDPFDPTEANPFQVGYWIREFGIAVDPSHANGLFYAGDDTVLLSLRHLSAIVAVEGLRANDGHIAWVTGADLPALPADYPFAEGGFEWQHHVTLLDDGTYTVFDNRASPEAATRGLRFALDAASGLATELASWPVDVWCPTQGSATLLTDDHMLIGCAYTSEAIEVTPAGDVAWRLRNSCDATLDNSLVRALPLTLGDVSL